MRCQMNSSAGLSSWSCIHILTIATIVGTAEEPMLPLALAFRIALEASVEGTVPYAHLLGHAWLVDYELSVRGALLSVGVGHLLGIGVGHSLIVGVGHAAGLLLLLVHGDGV
jgi:hypothetical protein